MHSHWKCVSWSGLLDDIRECFPGHNLQIMTPIKSKLKPKSKYDGEVWMTLPCLIQEPVRRKFRLQGELFSFEHPNA